MFFPGSRYENAGTYMLKLADGRTVAATRLPLPQARPLLGFHRHTQDQRLDLIAYHFLADATAFWRLCDANNAMVPDALAARALIGIIAKQR